MPRFEPGLEEGLALATTRLIEAAYGVATVDEGRLTELSKTLLLAVRCLRSSGMSRNDVVPNLGVSGTGADARHEERLHEFVRGLGLEKARVFCVTTEPDSPQMWNKYAEWSTGLVVELQHLPEQSTALLAARKVDYAAEPPALGSSVDFFLYGETDHITQASLQAIVSTKRVEWSYQSEWRVIWWLSESDGALFTDYPFLPHELVSIRFATGAAVEFRDQITNLVNTMYPHCTVRAQAR